MPAVTNVGFKGVDSRQSGMLLLVASLKDSNGADVTSGSATVELYEVLTDGSFKSFDFADNTFKTTTLTTATQALTHQAGNGGATSTGVWTFMQTQVSGFTRGAVYLQKVRHAGASPPCQERYFVYGDAEGDLSVSSDGLALADVRRINAQAANASAAVNFSAYVGTAAQDVAQGGDAYTRIGANGAGLTALGDARLGNLDAAVSTRSTYAGGDTAGTTTLLGRLTGPRATLLDSLSNLDAAVSTRSTYSGGPVASVTAAVTLPPIPDGWITADGIAAGALDDKGNWSAAADPFAVSMGAYADPTWGHFLADRLDARVSSRSVFDGGPVDAVVGDVGGRVLGGTNSSFVGTGVVSEWDVSADAPQGGASAPVRWRGFARGGSLPDTLELQAGSAAEVPDRGALFARILSGDGVGQRARVRLIDGDPKTAHLLNRWAWTPAAGDEYGFEWEAEFVSVDARGRAVPAFGVPG